MRLNELLFAWIAVFSLSSCSSPGGFFRHVPEGLVCDSSNGSECFSHIPAELAPGKDGFFELRDSLHFIDSGGTRWDAPASTLTDGASIPPLFIPIIGDRMAMIWREAAVLHDAYCARDNETLPQYQSMHWESVHRMFYDAMILLGTPKSKALVMYVAIYLGGPRWDDPERSLDSVDDQTLVSELERCLDWMEKNDPDLDAVTEWMKKREPKILGQV